LLPLTVNKDVYITVTFLNKKLSCCSESRS